VGSSRRPRGGLEKPIDWLEQHDRLVAKLPRATSWLNCSYFMFARHPRLQPHVVQKARTARDVHLQSGLQAFRQQISEWQTKIEGHQEARRTLVGLSSAQRRQLAAMISDTITILGAAPSYRDWFSEVRMLAREDPRRKRMIHRILDRIRQAAKRLEAYAKRLNPLQGREVLLDASAQIIKISNEASKRISLPDFESLYRSLELPEIEPVGRCTIMLYWFLKSGCKLSENESEVRVALVRNAFWTPYGIPNVKYQPKTTTEQSKGCPAVHQAVRRF
jgi:hypothetical protein